MLLKDKLLTTFNFKDSINLIANDLLKLNPDLDGYFSYVCLNKTSIKLISLKIPKSSILLDKTLTNVTMQFNEVFSTAITTNSVKHFFRSNANPLSVEGTLKISDSEQLVVYPLNKSEKEGFVVFIFFSYKKDKIDFKTLQDKAEVTSILEDLYDYTLIKDKNKELENFSKKNENIISIVHEINNTLSEEEAIEVLLAGMLKTFNFDIVTLYDSKGDTLEYSKRIYYNKNYKEQADKIHKFYLSFGGFSLKTLSGTNVISYINNTQLVFPNVHQMLDYPMGEKDKAFFDSYKNREDIPETIAVFPITLNSTPIKTICFFAFKKKIALSWVDSKNISFLLNALDAQMKKLRDTQTECKLDSNESAKLILNYIKTNLQNQSEETLLKEIERLIQK